MKLVLFDIDGTILSSKGTGRRAVKEALESVAGVEVDASAVSFAGRTDPAIMRDLLRASGLSVREIEDLYDRCIESYVAVLMRNLKPHMVSVLPGILSLIQSLNHRTDIVLGLLTGNLRDTAFLKLHAAGLGSYFPLGAYGSDHEDRNQLPVIAAQRVEQQLGLSISASKTVIIGDTPNDIRCAVHYGATSIAVCTGVFSRAELEPHQADILVDDLSDPSPVLDLLGSL